jgi:hypothetical protein
MKWFDNWFRRKCKEAWHSEEYPQPSVYAAGTNKGIVSSTPHRSGLDSQGLSLSIYGADGGTVLEFRHYDSSKDRSDYALHVISQSENFEERVANAITMEMMRKGIMR